MQFKQCRRPSAGISGINSSSVVVAEDIPEDSGADLAGRKPVRVHAVDQLFLERRPEAFDAGVIKAGTHAPHTLAQLMLAKAVTEGLAGELAAMVAVKDRTRLGMGVLEG